MTELRIIGVGSPFGDDQAGWLVARALQCTDLIAGLPCSASIIELDRPGVRLLHHFQNAHTVVLIDAICSGAPVGTIHQIVDSSGIEHGTGVSSHGLGVASALALARELGSLPSNLIVYGIAIRSATAQTAPSKTVVESASKLAQRICRDLLDKFGVGFAAPASG